MCLPTHIYSTDMNCHVDMIKYVSTYPYSTDINCYVDMIKYVSTYPYIIYKYELSSRHGKIYVYL